MTPEQMEAKLKQAYPDCDVAVIDTTGTQDHFDVRIASSRFKGLSRIERHKAVLAVFEAELKSGEVHALQVRTLEK